MNGEDALIERLSRRLAPGRRAGGLVLGIGDDAAIVRSGGRFDWALSADFTLEGVHFAGGDAPESVGYRALARATSDLGAMGARPAYYLLALALPTERAGRWLDRMLAGMARAARRYGLRLIGGDTTRMPQVLIAVTVIGRNRRGGAVRRSGARPGDRIFVSGRLGAAAAGLAVKRQRLEGNPRYRPFVRHHLYPAIPLELGIWLAERRLASAMIDLSDGLSSDLARLARASGVGARIFLDRVPAVSLPPALARRGLNREKLALDGGEDYGLLFTARRAQAAKVPREFRGILITCIGEVTATRSIDLIDPGGRRRPLRPAGWDPFREPA
ncbi:MAG TPA: thiamine-phosphate kinase [Candidatus Acidoferrales bacterium]|nr:thiamine-phosphate kinase [Candidatus Acidoferrales bacterium]